MTDIYDLTGLESEMDFSPMKMVNGKEQNMTRVEVEETIARRKAVRTNPDRIRSRRNELLDELDKIVSNPLRWNSMTDEDQQRLADYRQDLLDIPQQEGFPENVVWPDPIM